MANKAKTEEKQEPTRTEAIAITKGIHTTPRKVRLVVDTIRGKTLADAYGILANLNKSSVSVVLKTVKSAEANATNNYPYGCRKTVHRQDLCRRWRET
jgi:ribosomal protein L22